MPRPPAICFVDLTGYTQLTEERGDEVAARVAGRLAWLVNDVARSRGGRPVRWLGDGGLFHFREPWMAVIAGLDMVERAPEAGLPDAHVGIHTGPVVFQDGDVYGATVNVAARIASHAQAGQVVVSEETAHRSDRHALRFEPLGAVDLKGVAKPLPLYQAFRRACGLALRKRQGRFHAHGPALLEGPLLTRARCTHRILSADAGHGAGPSAGRCSVSMRPPPPPLVSRPGTCPPPGLRAGRARSRLARWV